MIQNEETQKLKEAQEKLEKLRKLKQEGNMPKKAETPPNQATSALNHPSNGKDQAIRENMEFKAQSIARATALNNACIMVQSVASVLQSTRKVVEWTDDNIISKLETLKDMEYRHNLKLLGIKLTPEDSF